MYIGDRKEREEYMDGLERQMEVQREQIRRTPDRMGGSSRRGGALDRLRGPLFRSPGRAPDWGTPRRRARMPHTSRRAPALVMSLRRPSGARERLRAPVVARFLRVRLALLGRR